VSAVVESLIAALWAHRVLPGIAALPGVMIFIGKEETQLTKAFGKAYEDYLTKVDRLVPFKKPRARLV
jgi:protein-S-isoprenylcysteine O-methyltransferase Ste14